MRKLSLQKMRSKAFKYNRKAFRKDVISNIKRYNEVIEAKAKKGRMSFDIRIKDSESYSWEAMVASRWFRMHSKFRVVITEELSHSKKGHRYVDYMDVMVRWD